MTARGAGRVHYAWVVLGATAVVLLAASGVRSAFGVFIKPMEAEFGWGRTALSLVASLSFVFNGAAGPVIGRLADRWGGPRGPGGARASSLGRRRPGGGADRLAAGSCTRPSGSSSPSAPAARRSGVAAAVASRWFDTRRGLAIGIAGESMAPASSSSFRWPMWLMLTWGWRTAFVVPRRGLPRDRPAVDPGSHPERPAGHGSRALRRRPRRPDRPGPRAPRSSARRSETRSPRRRSGSCAGASGSAATRASGSSSPT